MRECQAQLSERFRDLQGSRDGPVFFIEHGLNEEEVAILVSNVGQALAIHDLGSGWWQAHGLPIIVAATEVGYRYRGSGTDFWPVLEAEIDLTLTANDRQHVRDLFLSASKTYRGAKPALTPWNEAFHLIAWPITHALLPCEFHRPLALTLADIRVNVAGLSDDDLYRAIRIAASDSSARFSTFLEDRALSVAVTRRLLGNDRVDFCPQTMARIAADLTSDHVARRGVAVARRVQRTTPLGPTQAGKLADVHPTIEGALRLVRRDSQISLEAVFPAVYGDIQPKLRRALRRRRYAARLWGVSTRVPSEQLLSGLPFQVRLAALPAEDAPLLPGLEELDLDQELKDVLSSFMLDVTPPLLFAVASDEESARRVTGPSVSGFGRYWLLSESSGGPLGCPGIGKVGPYHCHLLDASEDIGREALERLGLHVEFGVSVAFAGAPPLDPEAMVPEFAVGDERHIIPLRATPTGLSVRLGAEETRLKSGGVVTVVIEHGDHMLRVSHGDRERQFRFRGAASAPTAPPTVCSIEARSDDMSVQALLREALAFGFDSFAPLKGLDLTVSVECGDRAFVATAPIPPLPCVISSAEEPFATLLDDETRSLLTRAESLTLTLSVGRLCSRSFTLTHRVRPCWWRQEADGAFALVSEVGNLPFGVVLATAPALAPTPAPPMPAVTAPAEALLIAPLELDESEHGSAAPFTTLCVAPSSAPLDAPDVRKPRLMRRRRGTHGALGLEDVAESYLRWSLAESVSPIAEFRRRQVVELLDGWLVEMSCGDEWTHHEKSLTGADPWENLLRVCDETGMGRDPYVKLSRGDEVEVTRLAVREIRYQLPELWARTGPPCDLGPEDYETLDLSFGRAYTKLAEVYAQRGMKEVAIEIGEGDPGSPEDEWDAVLERVKSTADLHSLAAMLLPTDSAHGLMTLDSSTMTVDEMTEELASWARGAERALAGNRPTPGALKAILSLWIEPETAVRLDWRAAIDVLVVDRAVARAVRYIALRSVWASRRSETS